MGALSKFKDIFKREDGGFEGEMGEDYVELAGSMEKGSKAKVIVRPFVIEDFTDVKPVLDCLREGVTIALVNIRPLKERDIVELKRAVSKLKKTCDAIRLDCSNSTIRTDLQNRSN